MIIHTENIRVGYGNTKLRIRPLGDIHLGHIGHDSKLFNKAVQEHANDPAGWCIITGDIIDDDRPSSRQKRVHMYSDRVDAQPFDDEQHQLWLDHKVIPVLKPLANRCLGALDGDHFRLYSDGTTSTMYICRKLKIPYLGERMAWVRMLFSTKAKGEGQRCMYLIHASHGAGSASTYGGDINALIRQVSGFEADLCIAGHTHKCMPAQIPILYPDQRGEKIREKMRTYVRTGGFLRGYLEKRTTYVEKAGYSPLALRYPVIELTLGRCKANNCSLSVEDVKVTI